LLKLEEKKLIIPQNPRKSKIKKHKGGNSIFLTHFAAPNFFLNHGMLIFLGTEKKVHI
jgi:hypothetical protein